MAASFSLFRCKVKLSYTFLNLCYSKHVASKGLKYSADLNKKVCRHVRGLSSSAPELKKDLEPSTSIQDVAKKEEKIHKESYIPITRQSIIRCLMQDSDFLTENEKKMFPEFALALDSVLVSKYHSVLQELKSLFDPINPDKDTIKTREFNRREKLDNEFWLLQQLEDVMEKANFREIPHNEIIDLLKEHEAQEGVRVSVDAKRYQVLRFWVLGHEKPEIELTLSEKVTNKILRRPARKAFEYYKRVIVAIRLKGDSKLILKAFKEIPVESLEMLLPDGAIKMKTFEKSLITTSVGIAVFGVFAKLVTVLANLHVDWMLVFSAITGTIGFRFWSSYKNKHNAYLTSHSRTLYFKNIANNRGLLTLLVDRAEDESFKEALLTYAFLMRSRPSHTREQPADKLRPAQLGGLTENKLEEEVENWIKENTGVELKFNSQEAVNILRNFGLLYSKDDKLNVLMLEAAKRVLPQAPQSVIARGATEADITEGFDRDEYLETETEYKEEDKKAKRYGWKAWAR